MFATTELDAYAGSTAPIAPVGAASAACTHALTSVNQTSPPGIETMAAGDAPSWGPRVLRDRACCACCRIDAPDRGWVGLGEPKRAVATGRDCANNDHAPTTTNN